MTGRSSTCELRGGGAAGGLGVAATGVPLHRPVHIVLYDVDWGVKGGEPVVYPGILFWGGSTNSVEDRGQRERGSGGGSPFVSVSGGSCNLIQ